MFHLENKHQEILGLVFTRAPDPLELLVIAKELLSKGKDSNAGKFILKTSARVTLFADLVTK